MIQHIEVNLMTGLYCTLVRGVRHHPTVAPTEEWRIRTMTSFGPCSKPIERSVALDILQLSRSLGGSAKCKRVA